MGHPAIDRPNFSRKEGRRVFWTSRIEIELEAGSVTKEEESKGGIYLSNLSALASLTGPARQEPTFGGFVNVHKPTAISPSIDWGSVYTSLGGDPSEKRVVTHKGRDKLEVLWSTEVTMSKDLKKAVIEDIKHVELSCQPTS